MATISTREKCDRCIYAHYRCVVQSGQNSCDYCNKKAFVCRTTQGRPPATSKDANGDQKKMKVLLQECDAINNRAQNTISGANPNNLTILHNTTSNMNPNTPVNSSSSGGQAFGESQGHEMGERTSSRDFASPAGFHLHGESNVTRDKGKGKATAVDGGPKLSRTERRAAEQRAKKALKKGGAQTQRVESRGMPLPSRRRGVYNMVANPILEPLYLRDGSLPASVNATDGVGQQTPPASSQAGATDGASASQSRIMCCSSVKTKEVGISGTSTFVQFVKKVAGQLPDRTVNADIYQIKWQHFDHIFGIVTYVLDDKKKFIGKTQFYGVKNDPSICGRYLAEVMEIVGTKGVGFPPVVSAYDEEDHKNECLIRMAGESSRDFVCKEHLPAGAYYVVYVCAYHPGDTAQEIADRESTVDQVNKTIAMLEKIEKQNPGSVYGGVKQTLTMVHKLTSQLSAGDDNDNGEGSSKGWATDNGLYSMSGGIDNGEGSSKGWATDNGEVATTDGGDGLDNVDLTGGGGGGGASEAAGGDGGISEAATHDSDATIDDMAWLKDVVYSDDDEWVGGVVSDSD